MLFLLCWNNEIVETELQITDVLEIVIWLFLQRKKENGF